MPTMLVDLIRTTFSPRAYCILQKSTIRTELAILKEQVNEQNLLQRTLEIAQEWQRPPGQLGLIIVRTKEMGYQLDKMLKNSIRVYTCKISKGF